MARHTYRCLRTRMACVLLIAPFLHACAGVCLLVHKEDLASMNARLEAGQRTLDAQSEKLDRLLESLEQQHDLVLESLEQQHDLVLEDMEHTTRAFEVLAQDIREQHAHTRRRMSSPGNLKSPTSAPFAALAAHGTEKLLVGEAERVRLTPPGRVFHARIDTGATISSLDARHIETFEREGEDWVRFKVPDPETGSLCEVEQQVARHTRIIQPGMEERDRRPVVRLQIQLGRMKVIEEFTLVDRGDLPYQVLIGRNILTDLFIVDVAHRFIVPLPESGTDGDGK